MTAIAGLVHGGKVYIGGDSAGSDGSLRAVRADTKVFTTGPYVFGFTTSFRMGQLLRWSLRPTAPEGGLERFLATTFVDEVRQCLKTGGWVGIQNSREEGGTFLLGVQGRLFTVYDDFQVGEAADGYDAVGSGDALALGALYATASMSLEPTERITLALSAAATHNPFVMPPFVICSS
jgi:ATP-dependent protease HslVU (ClpYQ) peptidase subunit